MAIGLPDNVPERTAADFKRKPMNELSDQPDDRLEALRLAPSATNSQPWYVTHDGDTLHLYREELGIIKQRTHGRSRWLVDQWVPAPGSAQVVQGNADPTGMDRSTPPPQGLGAVWLALPAGIIAMILAIPLTLGVREWRRSRRARRSYESSLPPLSQYGSGR
jgi:hypothetical protein